MQIVRRDIDWFIFLVSAVTVLAVVIPLGMYPEEGGRVLNAAFVFVTERLGVLYVLMSVFALTFLVYLGFSRHGAIVLGPPGQPPDFSTFSWAAMLFCGGIGTSVLYWGTIEWGYYYANPPYSVEPRTGEALAWATSYPIFHWGFTGWALYCLPGIASAYAYHVRRLPSLRLSSACEPLLGRWVDRWPGRVIDLTYTIGLIGATSTGIGLAVPLIGATLEELFGIPNTFALKVVVIAAVTAVFATSVWVGLEKGIKRLSNVAVWLAFTLLAFVFLVGPTVYLLEMATNSFGYMLQNFVRMSTWTDPTVTGDFVEAWTVFYWAWWLALGPFMGLFITKISGGRTISQVVFGSLGYGTLGCTVFFVILGSYAVHLEAMGTVGVVALIEAGRPADAVVQTLATLPLTGLVLSVFCIVCVIFAATSYDSASYTLASSTTRRLLPNEHPARWNRVFWAVLIGALPVALMYIGGLRPLQSAVVAVSVPLLAVVVLMTVGLMRNLKAREAPEQA